MNRNFNFSLLPVLLLLVLTGCQKSGTGSRVSTTETSTRGNIRIGVDDSFHLLADTEIATFTALYKYATIRPIYASEDSIRKLFLDDSIRTMITSRKLTANEEAYLKDKLVIVRTTQIAWDGLAFILNHSNPDTGFKYNQLKDIFMGNITTWKQINKRSRLGKLEVVFDNPGSSNVRYVMNKFKISGSLPENCYSANSNDKVIDYVEKHPEAIGIISVNWISDSDDSITHAFLKRVKVAGISPEFEPEATDFVTPHPAYIADKSYPFIREVYAITRETFPGLGRGFIQFAAHDQGQRIVLKMGMVPAQMPIRLVHISKQ
jgi:phosphate transport system substrate-binding protein